MLALPSSPLNIILVEVAMYLLVLLIFVRPSKEKVNYRDFFSNLLIQLIDS